MHVIPSSLCFLLFCMNLRLVFSIFKDGQTPAFIPKNKANLRAFSNHKARRPSSLGHFQPNMMQYCAKKRLFGIFLFFLFFFHFSHQHFALSNALLIGSADLGANRRVAGSVTKDLIYGRDCGFNHSPCTDGIFSQSAHSIMRRGVPRFVSYSAVGHGELGC